MARIRSVKPSLFGSYSLKDVPIEARYLFIGLFCEADDDGRLIDSPKRLAGSLFPHDEKVTANKIDSWLNQLAGARGEDGWPCIVRYETGSGRYICLPTWSANQKISHPVASSLPPLSGDRLEKLTKEAVDTLDHRQNGNGKVPT